MDATKPYKFIWLGAMDATKPYKFIGFGYHLDGWGKLGGFRRRPEASRNSAELSCSLSSFGPWSKHLETGTKPIEIGLCPFVGTTLGIIGLVSSGLGADLGSKSPISGRILKVFGALLAQPGGCRRPPEGSHRAQEASGDGLDAPGVTGAGATRRLPT